MGVLKRIAQILECSGIAVICIVCIEAEKAFVNNSRKINLSANLFIDHFIALSKKLANQCVRDKETYSGFHLVQYYPPNMSLE